MTQPQWTFAQIANFFQSYLQILAVELGMIASDMKNKHLALPSDFIDLTPENIIVKDNKEFYILEKKWSYLEEFDLGFLMFRSLESMFRLVSKWGRPFGIESMTRKMLIQNIFEQSGIDLTHETLDFYLQKEIRIQLEKYGETNSKLKSDFLDETILF